MLARLEAHVAEQQRFAANASHELRTPLAITQTLLEVARNDPHRDTGELIDRLHVVNTRAIDLTEALLLLSRADQRSFAREQVDLSLMAEEAAETLLPLAEKRGLTIETSGDVDPHHRLARAAAAADDEPRAQRDRPQPARTTGTVWVTTSVHPEQCASSPSRTPASGSPHSWSPRSPSRSSAAPNAAPHATTRGVGLGLAIVKSITTGARRNPHPHPAPRRRPARHGAPSRRTPPAGHRHARGPYVPTRLRLDYVMGKSK